MKFFTRKASRCLRTEKGNEKWDRIWEEYKQHLKYIRPKLSKGWRQLAATNFHDSRIFSFSRLDEASYDAEYIINIDMNPGWKRPPLFISSLHFYRVRRVELPFEVLKDWIVYDEVDVAARGTREWRALLGQCELRIQAEEVAFFMNHDPLV